MYRHIGIAVDVEAAVDKLRQVGGVYSIGANLQLVPFMLLVYKLLI